jgi:hypothetical protein
MPRAHLICGGLDDQCPYERYRVHALIAPDEREEIHVVIASVLMIVHRMNGHAPLWSHKAGRAEHQPSFS